ncbi:M48 family metallopeptidase [Pseudogemmobacter sp. W21_MBD1_M6]|uniref:M48 family metallopeptidase n=1 Tax=Pseudogemmobacter sp. W21_MBD1_M6 TaxID=3240271 RepID=UPI003F9AB15F
MRGIGLLVVLGLAGCVEVVAPAPAPQQRAQAPAPVTRLNADTAARNFATVVSRVEPVAEAECRARTSNTDCNLQIVVDDRAGEPPNAYQTLDKQGRPIIAFTLALIAEAQNQDELAFILGHEASHHIEGHIPRGQQSAQTGAVLGTLLGAALGIEGQGLETVQQIGATVGGRRFSKDYELEADSLGTVIAYKAGYDPVRGAQYFARIPDPGNRFLGSHPPNAARIDTVRRTAAGL